MKIFLTSSYIYALVLKFEFYNEFYHIIAYEELLEWAAIIGTNLEWQLGRKGHSWIKLYE